MVRSGLLKDPKIPCVKLLNSVSRMKLILSDL